jgi:hypothetical protein
VIRELCSCGQTGVAQGALEAARHCGLSTGGWMAQGFMTERGPAPELAERFGLKEVSRPGELRPIRSNVKDCDSTLWIAAPSAIETDPAYWATRKAVATYGHPFLVIPSKLKASTAARQIAEWAERWDVTRLHVAGPRASLWASGEERAALVVRAALHALGTCRPGPKKLALVS